MSFIKNFVDGSLKAVDGTDGTPLVCEVLFDNADFNVTALQRVLRAVKAYQTRGVLRGLRHGERIFPQIAFSAMLSALAKATGSTFSDFINGKAGTEFADRKSTTEAIGDVDTFHLVLTIAEKGAGSGLAVTFRDVHFGFDLAEGDPSQVAWKGTLYGAVTGDLELVTA